MKKTLLIAAFAALISGSAMAADVVEANGLPGVMVPNYDVKRNYAGVTLGQRLGDDSHTSIGAVVGRDLNDTVSVEGQYDRAFNRKENDTTTDRLMGNVLVGKRMGVVKPYGLVGAGYEWRNGGDRSVFAVGAGAKVAVTDGVDLDARYRYIDSFDESKRDAEHVIGLGVNVRF